MKKYILWLASLAIITLIFGTIYGVVQQSLRQSANDPQVQIAQDTAAQLNAGSMPEQFNNGRVDMRQSLAPFVIIYDKQGEPVGGSGFLDNKNPTIPLGVMQNSSANKYNAITWQPDNDVRVATVTVAANNYYVTSGRSLKEVEKRENKTMLITSVGWLASITTLAAAFWFKQSKITK